MDLFVLNLKTVLNPKIPRSLKNYKKPQNSFKTTQTRFVCFDFFKAIS
jgi:hypothetical protein